MNLQDSPIGFLFRKTVILIAFVAITGTNGVLVGLAGETPGAWMGAITAVLTYIVLALFTHKGFRIPTLALVFVMLINGMGSLFESFRNLLVDPSHQTAMNAAALLAGVYMIMGALVIFQGRDRKE